MGAAHAMFWPAILELLELDPGDLAPERAPDLSRPAGAVSGSPLDLTLRAPGGRDRRRRGSTPASCWTRRWRGSSSATRR